MPLTAFPQLLVPRTAHLLSSNLLTREFTTLSAMDINIKTFVLGLLLLLIPFSSGLVEGFRDNMHPTYHLLYKDGVKMRSRKLFGNDIMLDYETDVGANPRHKKPGTPKSP